MTHNFPKSKASIGIEFSERWNQFDNGSLVANQVRLKGSAFVEWKPGDQGHVAVRSSLSVEGRYALDGARQGWAGLIPVAGLEVSGKVNDQVSLYGKASYTINAGGRLGVNSPEFNSSLANPGWALQIGVRASF